MKETAMSETPALKKITPADLVALDDFAGKHPVKIDLVYGQPQHPDNMFKSGIYKPGAKMWAHASFAPIVLRAAAICYAQKKWLFELKDCLRPVEAQAAMMESDIVKANPHWIQEPNRLL